MQPVRIAIIGLGKIAREEHVRAITAHEGFALVAATGAGEPYGDLKLFDTAEAMFAACPEIDAVAVCTPPQAHFEAAKLALAAGKHVLVEKPPCTTREELETLTALAAAQGVSLFATWHARETEMVRAAARHLAGRTISAGRLVWKEDVRLWHPGQRWIWQEGGFGVFDAGINALSILTAILAEPLTVDAAHFLVPSNCQTPIAAAVSLATASGAMIDAEFDFRHRGAEVRSIVLDTDAGPFDFAALAAELGQPAWDDQHQEYPALYRRFAARIAEGRSEVDSRPLDIALEIFALAGRSEIPAINLI